MPNRPAPVPDEVLRAEVLAEDVRCRRVFLQSSDKHSTADLARELLALRDVVREHLRVAFMSSADFVGYMADTIGTERSLLARTRALLPECQEPPA